MFRRLLILAGLVLYCTVVVGLGGCADNVRTTKSVTTYEEEPARMASPGTEIVE